MNHSVEAVNPNEMPPRKSSAPYFVPLMLAALFMVTGICVLIFLGREKARIIGQTITELDIKPLLDAEHPISSEDMKGKVVILHFWGYWCGPCKQEYPDFVKLQDKYKEDPSVLFVSIACKGSSKDPEDALAFYTKKYLTTIDAYNKPIYHDPAEYTRTQISQLLTAGGFVYPTTLVLDGLGRVVDVWRTSIPSATLDKAIQRAKKVSAGS
jgi:cytochrome c biogenesis protein CcmG, thiol:disulfide interchange protein DsbE